MKGNNKSAPTFSYFDLVIWNMWYCLFTYFCERLQSDIQKSESLIKSVRLMDERSIKYLIWLRADVDSKDKDGWTPLHYLCMEKNPNIEAIKSLID